MYTIYHAMSLSLSLLVGRRYPILTIGHSGYYAAEAQEYTNGCVQHSFTSTVRQIA